LDFRSHPHPQRPANESTRRRIEGSNADALSARLDQMGARLDGIEDGLRNIGGRNRDEAH
jgi:hypothetical protein